MSVMVPQRAGEGWIIMRIEGMVLKVRKQSGNHIVEVIILKMSWQE